MFVSKFEMLCRLHQTISSSFIQRILYVTCLLLFVKADKTEIEIINEDRGCLIYIRNLEPFEYVTYAYLMEKIEDKNEYVEHTNVEGCTKTVCVKKDINEHEDNTNPTVDDLNEQINGLCVNMKEIEKVSGKTFALKFKTDTNLEINTKPFHYSEKNDKWEL